jgi:hypothetical protein
MTTRAGFIAIIVAVLSVSFAVPSLVAQTGSQSNWTSEQSQVWSNENSLWQNLLARDPAAWGRWWHESYSGWPGESQNPIGRNDVMAARDGLLESLKAGSLKYNLNPLGVNTHDNVAIVHYTFSWTAELSGGGIVTGSGRCTHTWLNEGGSWKILSGTGMLASFEGANTANILADADTRAIELINQLLVALKIEDGNRRLQAVVGLVHRSLLTSDGRDLDWNIKNYSYRKAFQSAHMYKYPAVVARTSEKRDQVVGFAESVERGWVQTYYLEVKSGGGGMPAPVQIFFPASGDPPKVLQMSL